MDATIELEHAIGCTTLIPNSVFYHPNGKDIVYISGACVGKFVFSWRLLLTVAGRASYL